MNEDLRLRYETVYVERWKSERVWFSLVLIISILIWILLTVTIIGAIYAVFLAAFFFLAHIGFIAYVRGSAVRIGPDQFPDLHARIEELSYRVGLENPPEAYLMQQGGALNALATKLFRTNFIILYSDLLEACGENQSARDMIIGHELGHIHAGHLNFMWFLIPGLFIPFIGTAYSRAREYTCDRYGAAVCGDKKGSLLGLTILAAGGKYAPSVNLQAFVKQQADLNTGLMTIGKWLSTHPPLSERIAALEPDLVKSRIPLMTLLI